MKWKFSRFGWLVAFAALVWPAAKLCAQTADAPFPVLQSDPLPPGAERRLGTNRLRLSGPAGYFMFSPNDSTIMVGAGGMDVHFWDAKTYQETWRTTALAFSCSPDGKHVAKTANQQTVEIWDVKKKALVKSVDLSKQTKLDRRNGIRIFDIEFNAAGDALWIGVSGQGAVLYDWSKDVIAKRIDIPNVIEMSLTQSRDRKTLAFRHPDNRIAVYDGVTGNLIKEFKNGKSNRYAGGWQALNHDGKILATINQNSAVAFTEVATGKTLPLIPSDALKELSAVPAEDVPLDGGGFGVDSILRYFFDSKGTHVLIVGDKLAVFDLAQKKIVATVPLPDLAPTALAVSNDNKTLALGYGNGAVEIRDLLTLKPLVDDPHPRGAAVGLAFARDGQSLATLHDSKTAVRLWNLPGGGLAKAFDIVDYPFNAFGRNFTSIFPDAFALAFLPGDRQLALGTRTRWNLATGARERLPDRKDRLVAASADGNRWLLVKENENQEALEIALHDAAAQREIAKLPLDIASDSAIPGHSVRASLSADGGYVGVHTSLINKRDPNTGEVRVLDDTVVVWNAKAAKPVPIFSLSFEADAASIALSPDGRFLSLRGTPSPDHSQQLWHLPTGFSLWKAKRDDAAKKSPNRMGFLLPDGGLEFEDFDLDGRSEVSAFSPDGQFLAGSGDKGLVVREALSGAILLTFTGQDGRVGDLAFSPGGRTLASATSDSTVMLWKIPTFAAAKPGVWKRERAETLWNNLRGEAAIAYQAMADLHAGGDEAVAILKDKIQPETEDERRLVQQTLADLESPQFLVREKATVRLEKWGFRLKPYLAESLAKTIDLEQKRRLTTILNRYKNVGIDPEELRLNRTVFLLERIGTPEARVVLESLARGHADDLTSQSARGTLGRLQKMNAKGGA